MKEKDVVQSWLSSLETRNMADKHMIQLFYDAEMPHHRGFLLKAKLVVADSDFWYGKDQGFLPWTWCDLLAWLSASWNALVFEEGYPIDVPELVHPGKLLDEADKVWEGLAEEARDHEELLLLSYLDRHDLSHGMPGAFLPSLIIARAGSLAWIVPEGGKAQQVPFNELKADLESIGDLLSEIYRHHEDPSIKAIITAWKSRNICAKQNFVQYLA